MESGGRGAGTWWNDSGHKRKLGLGVGKYGWRGTVAGEQIRFRGGEGARMWEGKGCREGVEDQINEGITIEEREGWRWRERR